MNGAFRDLITGWKSSLSGSPPYWFPGDDEIAKPHSYVCSSHQRYVTGPEFGKPKKSRLHVGLLPIPYIGNLRKASIFILMLNPGLSHGDYFAEFQVPSFRQALLHNLRQEKMSKDYPFLCLDPRFAWDPGFNYWADKFHSITAALATQKQLSYQDALKHLAKRIACLELVPYHSRTFSAHGLLGQLPSSQAICAFVSRIVVPKAKNGRAIIISTRGNDMWNLPKHRNIIVYQGTEVRAAHLGLKSRGGQKIARFLGLRL